MKKYISFIFASLMMCSCVDTIILPNDRTVEEDFWQTADDVDLMVGGAYKEMIASGLINNLIVWGDFRSDELVVDEALTSGTVYTNLKQIETGNIKNTNTYANWATLYSVINYCNLVIDKSAQVLDLDPEFTEGTYLERCAQMKALRALCYFYLVRTFRDVPYSATAYTESSQDRDLPQSAPAVVLANCIKDLEEALPNAMSPTGYSDWRKYGLINQDAIRTILADIYLWRASMTHSASDYQQCVNYCQQVIDSKKQQNGSYKSFMTTLQDSLLVEDSRAYTEVFIDQNSVESILELQYDGTQNSNSSVCGMYYKYSSSASTGYTKASNIFSSSFSSYDESSKLYMSYYDWRRVTDVFDWTTTTGATFSVRKMIGSNASGVSAPSSTASYGKSREDRAYANFAQNYILYRVSDVMLMKAEALVQLAPDEADNKDPYLAEAFELAKKVCTRSIQQGNKTLVGSTFYKASSYNSKSAMETLVLRERLAELCFEGKRWYDLVRYNYRHMEKIADINKTMSQLAEEGYSFGNNYDDMLSLMARKSSSNSSALTAKMKTEPYLYMPVLNSQIKANPQLKQNPAYDTSDESVKK